MSDLQAKRLNYDEQVAITETGGERVIFTDEHNKFIDDVIAAIDDIDESAEIGVSAYLTADEALAAGVEEDVTNYSEDWDLGDDFASGVFTAPRAGKYGVVCQANFSVSADQDRLQLKLYKNSTVVADASEVAASTVRNSVYLYKLVELAVGDTLKMAVENANSADTLLGGASNTYFQIQYLDKSVTPGVAAGGGTVTSVAVSGSDGIEVDSGSPITTTGTIALGVNATTLNSHLGLNLTSGAVAFGSGTGITQDAANLFYDDTNDRLGVGTNTPLQTLHLTSSTTQAGFQCHNSTTGTTATDGFAFGQVGGSTVLVNYEVGNMGLYTAGTERFTIDSVGNIGINDTTPTERLEVDGNIAVTGTVDGRDVATDGGKLDNITIGTAGSIAFSNGTALTQDNANLFWDDTNNRIGVGTTTPREEFHAHASGGTFAATRYTNGTSGSGATDGFEIGYSNAAYIWNYENTGIIFATNNATRVTIAAGGNIGFGESSPDTKIHVDGAITQNPLSADPANPDTGNSIMWVSDGTESGDAGDVMMKINVGGTTKTITLVDYSTF